MSFYVIDIGAKSLCSLLHGVLKAVGEVPRLSVVFAENADECLFEEVDWRLDSLIPAMADGQVIAAMISTRGSEQASAVVYPKTWAEREMGFCLASIDIRTSADQFTDLFDSFCRDSEVIFCCCSTIDSVILDLDPVPTFITVENFPWDHWDLMEAAVRRSDWSWERRLGPREKRYLRDVETLEDAERNQHR